MLWKWFNRFFKDDIYRIDRGADQGKIAQWLWSTFSDVGFMHYYTVRKKRILEVLSTGQEQEEYWKLIGRLEELKGLSQNVKDEAKRRKDNEKKKKNKEEAAA